MKANKYILILAMASSSIVFSNTASSDQVINDDLIVTFDTCIGIDCADGEVFDFDGLKLKSNDPQIMFDDTSNSASFPSNDWSVGISDNAQGGPADFSIKDITSGMNVMVLQAGESGGVALGAGSSVEENAISVGATGNERQIKHVANGVNSTDAINLSQLSTVAAPINDRIDALNVRIDELLNRISKL